ncbi:hypothetical protein [Roseibium sp.]|uniref:hypothetical protein n=1 Tax=Roseibium sp. TaxID=1936156 RepID=UPI003A9879DB
MYFLAFSAAKLLDPVGMIICLVCLFSTRLGPVYLRAIIAITVSTLITAAILGNIHITTGFTDELPHSFVGAIIQTAASWLLFLLYRKWKNAKNNPLDNTSN